MKRAVILLITLAAGACSRTPSPEAGELRVTPLGGDVRIIEDGESSQLEEAVTVNSGVGLITGSDGRVQVELPSGASVELAPEAELRVDGDEPQISSGSALIRATSDITVHAGLAGEAEITAADSIFRIDSDISVRLAVYRGAATVLGSQVGAIEALEQATIVQGSDIYRLPGPMEVRPNDPWDSELLGDAIELGLRLAGLEKGLSRQLPSGREAEAVSRSLEEAFPASRIRSALEELGDAASVVVAAVLAEESERLDGRSRARIFADVVNLQRLGANWIVVVAKWGLARAAAQVLATLGDIASTIAEPFAPPPAPSSTSASTSSAAGGPSQTGTIDQDPGGEGSGGPGPGNNPKDPPGGGGTQPPAPPPPEPGDDPAQSCGNEVECAVDDVLDDTPGGT
jgi:hypothetical protein